MNQAKPIVDELDISPYGLADWSVQIEREVLSNPKFAQAASFALEGDNELWNYYNDNEDVNQENKSKFFSQLRSFNGFLKKHMSE